MRPFAAIFSILLLCAVALASPAYGAAAADQSPLISDTNQLTSVSNELDAMRAYLELQSQIHAAQLSLEQNQQEAASESARVARQFNDRFDWLEKSHEREIQTVQSNSRVVLTLACIFMGMGFVAMFFTGYLQWRSLNRMTEVILASHNDRTQLPIWQQQLAGAARPEIASPGESTVRLLDVVERLEKRILQLEHTSHPPVRDVSAKTKLPPKRQTATPAEGVASIALLLGKGQSLLNLDKPEDAIICFDEILEVDNNNTEALVKKGVALERLRKLNEAIECYDRAIAADSSMTIAYLYKGGVYNRLEKFNEALDCYEKALRSQDGGDSAVN